jgi:hypothetical protein
MATVGPFTICPVCGYNLGFAPWKGNSAADEMCPCCGIQFGYDDFAGGDIQLRQAVYGTWREEWIRGGMKWSSKGSKPPSDWDPSTQLKGIGST